MLRSILLVGSIVLAQTESSSQPDPSDAKLAGQVRQWVRQLDGDSLASRESGEKSLIELGPDALVHLPQITSETPAEVKERLGRVKRALEKAAAEAIVEPTWVDLVGEMSVVEALDMLARQTGNRMVGFQGRTGTVNVTFKQTLYWEALDQILDQGRLNINPFGGHPNALVVVSRPQDELPRYGPALYEGVFRIEATRLEARRDLRNPAVNALRLTLNVAWEPRISPISVRQSLSQLNVLDDAGRPLAVPQGRAVLNAPVESGISGVELTVPLELPDRTVTKIGRIEGTMTVLMPGRAEAFTFSDLSAVRDVTQQKAGASVTFERIRKNLELYEVRVRVRFEDAGAALESHRGWVYGNEAFILDAEGKQLENVGLEATRQAPNEIGVAYLFDLPQGPDGCEFVYKTPALILQLPVKYELRDISLP